MDSPLIWGRTKLGLNPMNVMGIVSSFTECSDVTLRTAKKKRKPRPGSHAALSPLVHRDSPHVCGCVFEWISRYGLTDTYWRCVCVHQLLTLNVLERSEKEDD